MNAPPSPPSPWIGRAIVGLGAACVALAGLLALAVLQRSSNARDAAADSEATADASSSMSLTANVLASDDDAGMMASTDGPSMSGPAEDGAYDAQVVAKILKELDSLDWTTPKSDEPAAAPAPRAVVGRDWLPRVAASRGQRRDVSAFAAAIDAEIDQRLQAVGVSSAGPASDAEFLRRVSLDLVGHIPTVEQTLKFLGDTRVDKRALLIDELLAQPEFGFRLAHYWRDLLLKRDSDKRNLPNEPVFVSWLARQFNHDQPWDKTVRAMLTAEGDEALAGETFFLLVHEDGRQPAPNKIIATTSALFMGIQLQCAECHVHPTVDHWKPDDFWGLAAFFTGTRAERLDSGKGKTISGTAQLKQRSTGKGVTPGRISIPDPKVEGRTIGVASAHLFEGEGTTPDSRAAHRGTLADWLASEHDPYFAPAAVNRFWSVLMARGLVEPLDDFRPDNPPSHPELLTLLTNEFVAADFNLKHLIRGICNSQAYQRTSRPVSTHEDQQKLYAHATIKVLTPDMLFDSLTIATGGRIRREGATLGDARSTKTDSLAQATAVEFYDNREYDEAASEYVYGIPQLLRLMNRQLTAACDEIGQREAAANQRDRTIERMYLAAYSRHPTAAEVERMRRFVGTQRAAAAKSYSAMLWALLNSAEFFVNH